MVLNILELVMLMLYVLARIAGTVAIVWLILDYGRGVNLGSGLLVAIAIAVGLAFSVHYDNPNAAKAPQAVEQTKE